LAALVDRLLRPHIGDRYDLKTLEIAPGAGRFTAELIRFSSSLVVVDMNSAAIDVCRERLAYYPTPVRYVVNNGRTLDPIADEDFDLIASFDSMVHMHPTIVHDYIRDSAARLEGEGLIWFDHSGKGERAEGHRSAVTAEYIRDISRDLGLRVNTQHWRNEWDCISVLQLR
jgi:SAM-dependent methyltransferase